MAGTVWPGCALLGQSLTSNLIASHWAHFTVVFLVKWSNWCKFNFEITPHFFMCLIQPQSFVFFFFKCTSWEKESSCSFPLPPKILIWTYPCVYLSPDIESSSFFFFPFPKRSHSSVCLKAFSPSHREFISFSLEGLCMSVYTLVFIWLSSFFYPFFLSFTPSKPTSLHP